MAKRVVHFEIVGPDMAAMQAFYSSLFEWEFHEIPEMNYALAHAKDGEDGIDGGLGNVGEPRVTIYMAVPDPQATLDAAVAQGATELMPVTTIPDGVTMAMFTDPAGNAVGIVKDEMPSS